MRVFRVIYPLFLLACLTACNEVKLRNVEMKLYTLYPNNAWSETNTAGFRRVLLEPYVLVISEDNRLTLTGSDIKTISIATNDSLVHCSLIFKKTVRQDLQTFTTRNSNSLVAVMVDGEVRNIARIDGPIRNGKLKFSARLSRMPDMREFVRLFLL
jgi:preprotein translocase subunit SecD